MNDSTHFLPIALARSLNRTFWYHGVILMVCKTPVNGWFNQTGERKSDAPSLWTFNLHKYHRHLHILLLNMMRKISTKNSSRQKEAYHVPLDKIEKKHHKKMSQWYWNDTISGFWSGKCKKYKETMLLPHPEVYFSIFRVPPLHHIAQVSNTVNNIETCN